MTIAEKIVGLREKKGISQYKLAKESGITSQAICQYESGKRIPDLPRMMQLCKGLGIDANTFLSGVNM